MGGEKWPKSSKNIREHLESERKRLTEELKLKVIPSVAERHEGSPYGKREETATESFELEKRLALVHRIREQLTEVECALDKLEKGTYGLCDSCGKPIPLARLEAMPQANLCWAVGLVMIRMVKIGLRGEKWRN